MITGGEVSGETNLSINSESERPENKRAGANGDPKGPNRQKSPGLGPWGAVLWAGIYDGPNSGLHEADLLGAELGRDGAHMLLRHLPPLLSRLWLLPQDLHGALF